MSESANVQSLEALRRIRSSIILFIDEAGTALRATETELQMTKNWLHNQARHWKEEIKRWQEELEAARAELFRKRVSRSLHDAPNDGEQRDNVKQCERRLAEAEDMYDLVKSWEPDLFDAGAQYQGLAAPLMDRLTGDFENAVFKIDRMLDTLEKYIHLAAPETAKPATKMSRGPTEGGGGDAAPTKPEEAKPGAPEAKPDAQAQPAAAAPVAEEPVPK